MPFVLNFKDKRHHFANSIFELMNHVNLQFLFAFHLIGLHCGIYVMKLGDGPHADWQFRSRLSLVWSIIKGGLFICLGVFIGLCALFRSRSVMFSKSTQVCKFKWPWFD